MQVERRLAAHGNLYPRVYDTLNTLPAAALHHDSHRLAHPGGIYNKSLQRVLPAFEVLLDQAELILTAPLGAGGVPSVEPRLVLDAVTELLDAFMAHMDDCYAILKALTPMPTTPPKSKHSDAWLEHAKHPTIKAFKDAIATYRGAIAPIVNRVKHEHGRFGNAILVGETSRVFGYYVEGPDGKGGIGPDPVIHPKKQCISIHRDLRFHFVHLFHIGEALHDAIAGAGIAHASRKVEADSVRIAKVASRIAHLPLVFLQYEVNKPVPSIRVAETLDSIRLTFPSQNKPKFLKKARVHVTTPPADGFARTFSGPATFGA